MKVAIGMLRMDWRRWGKAPALAFMLMGLLVAYLAARELGDLSFVIAVVLWAAALLGFLHSEERLTWVDHNPRLEQLLTAYVSPVRERPYTATPSYSRPAPATPRPFVPDPLPATAPLPIPDISGFVVEDITEVGKKRLLSHRDMLTESRHPGVCVLFRGPEGTGKTSHARNMLGRLSKDNIVKTTRVVALTDEGLHQLDDGLGPDPKKLKKLLAQGLDGVILLDNLTRLVAASDGRGTAVIGQSLSDLAHDHPHRVFVVVVGTTDEIKSLNPPGHEWIKNFDGKFIEVPAFSRKTIEIIMANLLLRENLQLSYGAEHQLSTQISAMVAAGEGFQSGHTINTFFGNILTNQRHRLSKNAAHDRQKLQGEDIEYAEWRIHQ
jgi:hypothetical protein